MNYYQINLPKPSDQDVSDILIAQMAEVGFESFEETDTQVIAYIPEKDYSKTILQNIGYCQQPKIISTTTTEFIADRNWNEVWESNYPSVTIGNRCLVRAPFHPIDETMEYNIVISPKMAFGTAHHETTAQMLDTILNTDLQGKEVLDMGCGSGVLAILCALKGAKKITAIDFDEWSYSNTLENAKINGIENIETLLGDANLLKAPMLFDIIFANINKNILLRDMEAYTQVLTPGGNIYFSGFYTDDLKDIKQKANNLGLKLVSSRSDNNWVVAHFIHE